LESPEAGRDREARSYAATLEERVCERRQVLIQRMPQAQAAELDDLFMAVLVESAPGAGELLLVADQEELRVQLARIDAALERLHAAVCPARHPATSVATRPDHSPAPVPRQFTSSMRAPLLVLIGAAVLWRWVRAFR
jgi:hypothetical protein